jgi:hypothetical protein
MKQRASARSGYDSPPWRRTLVFVGSWLPWREVRAPAHAREPLKHSVLGKAEMIVAADDDVIEHLHIEQL